MNHSYNGIRNVRGELLDKLLQSLPGGVGGVIVPVESAIILGGDILREFGDCPGGVCGLPFPSSQEVLDVESVQDGGELFLVLVEKGGLNVVDKFLGLALLWLWK